MIDNGLVLSQVNANWFQFAIGALTIFAVVGNAWMRKRGRGDEGGDRPEMSDADHRVSTTCTSGIPASTR